ncbi:hypothetical protein EDC54_102167 [Samsonia erythrinae]|uniref:Uncharacterized protein n=1 Tax=Samsonia erythrinae TaxID=160434 RepID=A0A4V6P2Y9_9GAMM|nr:hypothetical protein EDC54_102167 [Samsonia erythrinae]
MKYSSHTLKIVILFLILISLVNIIILLSAT